MSELKACPVCQHAMAFEITCRCGHKLLSSPPHGDDVLVDRRAAAAVEVERAALALLLDKLYGLHARPGHAALILSTLAALRATPGACTHCAGKGKRVIADKGDETCPYCKGTATKPAIVETYEKVREAYEESKGTTAPPAEEERCVCPSPYTAYTGGDGPSEDCPLHGSKA